MAVPHLTASASKAGIASPCMTATLSTSASKEEAHQIAPLVWAIKTGLLQKI